MAVADTVKPEKPSGVTVPTDIQSKLDRGSDAMHQDASLRRLCQKFWKGDHYWYVNAKGALRFLSTAIIDQTGGKPDHRIRNTYNFIASIIEGKVSSATQMIPGYEVDASSTDAEDQAAARIAEKVAFYGYDKWKLRRARSKVITLALVQREGFAFPYFDPNVGPFKATIDGVEGLGEIKVLTFSRSEVMWEPGQDFLDSRWHAVQRAMLVDDIKQIPGYMGGGIVPDASTSDVPTEKRSDEMAVLTDYLERPCSKYPNGRRCFIVNKRVVVDYRLDPTAPDDADWYEPYPYMDANGVVADEPVIHRLSYTVNPEGDDLGLVERLIDLMRTVNDCWNKLLEWKNRALLPQMKAPRGSRVAPRTDVPGAINYFNPVGGMSPEWEQVPQVPNELFQMLQLAVEHMRALAADVDVQPDPRLTTATAQTAVQQAQSRWASFLGDTEDFDSRLMRHCLCLVARFYTQDRIVDIRGQYGWEPPISFTGQDIRSQVNVRVNPGSLTSKTRQETMQEIEFLQTNFPGSISPEAASAALNGGSAEGLLRSYELDVAMANDVVQKLRQGPEGMLLFEPRFDPELGDPALGFMVPGWMPRIQDNVAVWKQVIGDYTKTPDYQGQPPEVQHTFDLVYQGLEMQEQRRQMLMAQQEMSAAAELGAQNAAKPQGEIPGPSQAPMTPQKAAPEATAPPG